MAEASATPNPPKTPVRWGLLALAVAGFAGIAIYLGPGGGDETHLPPELADEPDLYLEQGVITEFRDDGSLHYRLRADLIRRYERLGRSGLEAPVLDLHERDGAPWRMASRTGEVRAVRGPDGKDEEHVELTGDVTVTREHSGGFVRMRTESLVIVPARQQARSDQAAMIETDTMRVHAGGFEADLARGRLSFSSSTDAQVHIVAEPDQPTSILR